MMKNLTFFQGIYFACFLSVFTVLYPVNTSAQAPVISIIQGAPVNVPGKGIAYGNGAYVAIFNDGMIFRSADGNSWSPVSDASIPAGSFNKISFGAGVFVLIGQSGLIASSANGINWTIENSTTANHLYDIQFLNSSFYVVGANRTVRQSTDGHTWNTITVNAGVATDNLNSIDYGNGVYAIGARNSGQSGVFVYRSTTGASDSWTFQNVVSGSINRLQYLGNRFYIFMSNTHVYTSADAGSWTNSTTSLTVTLPNSTTQNIGSPNQTFHGIYDGTKWYLYGYSGYHGGYGSVFSSTNGTHFTLEPRTAYIVAQGSAYINGRYFLYGNEGMTGSGDGVNYTFYGGNFTSLATSGSGKFVAVGSVGSSGNIFSTTDFAGWTNHTGGFMRELNTVLYDGSRFVSAGNQQVIASVDGDTWNTLSTPSYNFTAMAYGNARYVAGGYDLSFNTSIRYSPDGINWTVANTSNVTWLKIRYVNGQYFAVGCDNDTWLGVIMHSANGTSWTDITPSPGYDVAFYSDVVYDGSKYHVIGVDMLDYDNFIYGGFFSISTATPTSPGTFGNRGTITNAPSGAQPGGYWGECTIAYSNGRFAGAVSDINTSETYMIYSTDGVSWTAESTDAYSYVFDVVAVGDKFHMAGSGDYKFIINFASTLPVTLTRFDAKLVNADAVLSWSTASEINSREFRVQHSTDGQRWEQIGTVAAAGNSDQPVHYQYRHASPAKGSHLYRLLQVDIDGRQAYSDIRKLQVLASGTVRLYPNPGSGNTRIQRDHTSRALVTVVNSQGQQIYRSWHSGNQVELPSASWPAGIYQVKIDQDVITFLKQ